MRQLWRRGSSVRRAISAVKRVLKSVGRKSPPPNYADATFLPTERDLEKRRNRLSIEIDSDSFFEVYWRMETMHGSSGPSAILHINAKPIVKFDCLGPGKGHMHLDIIRTQKVRRGQIWMPEQTIEQQIDRTMFELRANIHYWLLHHSSSDVRNYALPTGPYEKALIEVRQTLVSYHEKVKQQELASEEGKGSDHPGKGAGRQPGELSDGG